MFKPAACHAGIPDLTFHDLRHTGASLIIAAGRHVKVIAEQMGHSDGGALVLDVMGTSTRARASRPPLRSRITSFPLLEPRRDQLLEGAGPSRWLKVVVLVGLTIVGAWRLVERNGAIVVTPPQLRVERDELAAVLAAA